MAVAFGSIVNVTPTSGNNTGPSPSITTPTTDPVVVVSIGLNSTTVTVTSLTITGFGGTATEISTLRNGTTYVSVWNIVAPTANTAGTVQGNFSAAVSFQMAVEAYSGAHQTTPCPTGDIVTSSAASTSETLTPLNLTANDASVGTGVNTTATDPTGVDPNNRFTNATTTVNAQVGDNTGTTGVTFKYSGTSGEYAKAAVRIAAAAAAGGWGPLLGLSNNRLVVNT